MDSGLRDDEERVMDLLVAAWNAWRKIDDLIATDEMRDFNQAIRTAQMIVMCRIVRRAYPEYWR